MNLSSFTFLAFLVVFILIYFIIPKKIQWIFLLLSSLLFMFYQNIHFIAIACVLSTLIIAYISAIFVEKYKDSKKGLWSCIIGVLLVLTPLILFKYINFIGINIEYISHLFGGDYIWYTITTDVPIGISYYTLIMIGYIIDVYRKTCKAQTNILKCALFMCYFPQLTSGPVTRYSEEHSLFKPHKFNYYTFTNGLIRILWGFFKILVISSRASIFVNGVYNDIVHYNGFYIVIAALLFTIQLYTNFSGSIDIIMGVSEIIGIELPENFQQPFFSKSITEFWRRWHISLGDWLRDFIFYPLLKSNIIQGMTKKLKSKLGKKWGKRIPIYIAMFILWTVIGIWHGGSYNYLIATGWIQFVYLVIEDISEPWMKKITAKLVINRDKFVYKIIRCMKTYIMFSFALIFFRAENISSAIAIIKNIFITWNPYVLYDRTSLFIVSLDKMDFVVMILSIFVLFVVEWLQRTRNVRESLSRRNIIIRWTLLYTLIFVILIFGSYGPGYSTTEFIYQQF